MRTISVAIGEMPRKTKTKYEIELSSNGLSANRCAECESKREFDDSFRSNGEGNIFS